MAENTESEKSKVQTLKIISAVPLNETEKSEALKKAGSLFGPDCPTKFEVDRKILGGLIFRTEDKILDLSLKEKLNLLKKIVEEN